MNPTESFAFLREVAEDSPAQVKNKLLELADELERLIEVGFAWESDSSLEKWLPFTAEELSRLREAIPTWIPCSERLPEEKGLVLTWDGKSVDVGTFGLGAWSAAGKSWWNREGYEADDITHWMPLRLPEPPPPTKRIQIRCTEGHCSFNYSPPNCLTCQGTGWQWVSVPATL